MEAVRIDSSDDMDYIQEDKRRSIPESSRDDEGNKRGSHPHMNNLVFGKRSNFPDVVSDREGMVQLCKFVLRNHDRLSYSEPKRFQD